jgi:hypothetical protein
MSRLVRVEYYRNTAQRMMTCISNLAPIQTCYADNHACAARTRFKRNGWAFAKRNSLDIYLVGAVPIDELEEYLLIHYNIQKEFIEVVHETPAAKRKVRKSSISKEELQIYED